MYKDLCMFQIRSIFVSVNLKEFNLFTLNKLIPKG